MARLAVLCVVTSSLVFGTAGGQATHAQALAKGKRLELDTLGEVLVVREPNRDGLSYFPDQGISLLGRDPLRFLLVAGNATWLTPPHRNSGGASGFEGIQLGRPVAASNWLESSPIPALMTAGSVANQVRKLKGRSIDHRLSGEKGGRASS